MHAGKYDPNKWDTDGNGRSDGVDMALADPEGDFDNDGMNNSREETYGTDPTNDDSDCDGAKDQAELSYWGDDWNTGGNRLLTADVDGDGVKDGVEIGTVGTPHQALYRTDPELVDTDGDGLDDDEEAQNQVRVSCNGPQTGSQSSSTSTSSFSLLGFIEDVFSPSEPVEDLPGVLNGLTEVDGWYVGEDEEGWYVQGGYGVKLYVNATETLDSAVDVVAWLTEPQAQSSSSSSSSTGPGAGTNGQTTHPLNPDTDGDGLTDGEEVLGLKNPYDEKYDPDGFDGNTNPNLPDSDRDGISDGAELGYTASGGTLSGAWPVKMNPNLDDTDRDGVLDRREDANHDGKQDLNYNSFTGEWTTKITDALSSPVDADTDDDGIRDDVELMAGSLTNVLLWDTDKDGLSDGLETGVTSKVVVDGVTHTEEVPVFGLPGWKTWQPWQGDLDSFGRKILSPVNDPDWDDDGLLDGLEDWNHNGDFKDTASFDGLLRTELDPQSPDTDGDKLSDARELLVFVESTAGLTASFADLFGKHGLDVDDLVYDSGNVWETDPRLPDTDLDGIVDGLDMNPRLTENFVGVWFESFEFLDRNIDNSFGDRDIELFVSPLTVDLPFMDSEYVLQMNPGSSVDVYFKDSDGDRMPASPLPDELFDKLHNPDHQEGPSANMFGAGYNAQGVWKVQRIQNEPLIRFQLPEGIDNVNPTDMKVTIKIQFMDEDISSHDSLDLNPDPDTSKKYGVVTIDLLGDTAGTYRTETLNGDVFKYFDKDQVEKTMVGNRIKSVHSNDARLKVTVGDTIPLHFADALKVTKLNQVAGLQDHGTNLYGSL